MDATGYPEDAVSRPEDGPFPVIPRIISGAMGAGLGLHFAGRAGALHADGLVLSAIAVFAVAFPVALFLLLVGIAPSTMQRALGRVSRVDLRDAGQAVTLTVFTGVLFLVFGMGAVVSGVFGFETVILGRGNAEPTFAEPVGQDVILQNLIVNTLLFVIPVILWLTFVGGMGARAALRNLGFRESGALPAFGVGLGFAVGVIFAIGVTTLALQQAGVTLPANEQAVAIATSLTVGGAVVVAALSSLGEEVLFRGFLLPRIGMLPQGVLFALAHSSYLNVMQLVVTFALGIGFAWLYRRTGNLWAPVGAHFAFNLIMLVSVIMATEG